MKKILFFSILIFGILSFGIAKADVSCVREPAGTPIYNNDPFNFSCTEISVPAEYCNGVECLYMDAMVSGDEATCTPAGAITSTLEVDEGDYVEWTDFVSTENSAVLNLSDTNEVGADGCFISANSVELTGSKAGGNFDVVEGSTPTPSAGFFNPEDVSASVVGGLGVSKNMITDLLPLLGVALGFPVGFWIVRKVILFVRVR